MTNNLLTIAMIVFFSIFINSFSLFSQALVMLQNAENPVSYEINDASFLNSNDGKIVPVVTGGYPPYDFNWSGPNGYSSQDSVLSNLEAGTYYLNIRDRLCGKLCDTIEIASRERAFVESMSFSIREIGPIPCFDKINVWIESIEDQELHFTLVNTNGEKFKSDVYQVQKDKNKIEMDVSFLPEGIYIMNFCNLKNCKRTERIMKLNSK